MKDPKRKTALITGATSGIGLAFTKLLAKEGYDLMLVASGIDRLLREQRALQQWKPHLQVMVFCQDLCEEDAAEKVYEWVNKQHRHVDLLINNAGFGLVGPSQEIDASQEKRMLRILTETPTMLCKYFLRDMYEEQTGCIVNVASTGAFQPGPYTASYYAAKSYLYQYSQAVRLEARKNGVQVITLCPGTTRTKFFAKTGKKTPIWAMTPEKVVEAAWKGIQKDQAVVVPGIINQLLRLVPANLKAYGVALLKK